MTKVEKNWLEWTVFGASLCLVLGVLTYLGYEAIKTGDRPPSIEVRLGAPAQAAQGYMVPVAAVNRGDQPAEGVTVEVTLEAAVGGAVAERGEVVFAFLPRSATREGWVTFHTEPRAALLKARVLGYEKP
ncbi:MAG: hypothetical protein ACRD9R_11550 [Pyrinomonadaceae bacterium]